MRKRSQATLEYVIMLTGIIAAIVFAASQMTKKSGTTETGLRKVFSDTSAKMKSVTGNLKKDFFE